MYRCAYNAHPTINITITYVMHCMRTAMLQQHMYALDAYRNIATTYIRIVCVTQYYNNICTHCMRTATLQQRIYALYAYRNIATT